MWLKSIPILFNSIERSWSNPTPLPSLGFQRTILWPHLLLLNFSFFSSLFTSLMLSSQGHSYSAPLPLLCLFPGTFLPQISTMFIPLTSFKYLLRLPCPWISPSLSEVFNYFFLDLPYPHLFIFLLALYLTFLLLKSNKHLKLSMH